MEQHFVISRRVEAYCIETTWVSPSGVNAELDIRETSIDAVSHLNVGHMVITDDALLLFYFDCPALARRIERILIIDEIALFLSSRNDTMIVLSDAQAVELASHFADGSESPF